MDSPPPYTQNKETRKIDEIAAPPLQTSYRLHSNRGFQSSQLSQPSQPSQASACNFECTQSHVQITNAPNNCHNEYYYENCNHVFRHRINICGILMAIFFFPFGLIFLLCITSKECVKCGRSF